MSQRIHIYEDRRGNFKVWEEPVEGAEYILGADIALGRKINARKSESGDDSAFVILKRTQFLLTQVAEVRIKCEAAHFGNICGAWGQRYNTALINLERNLADAPFASLRRMGYPLERMYQPPNQTSVSGLYSTQYFFQKSQSTQKFLVDTTIDYLGNGSLVLKSRDLLTELRTLQKDERGIINTKGKDLSIALMMAVIAAATSDAAPVPDIEPPPPPEPPFGVDPVVWRRMRGIAPHEQPGDNQEFTGWEGEEGPPEWNHEEGAD